jgi:tripartite-type tricarboxylate transporter receptor subunit TctC
MILSTIGRPVVRSVLLAVVAAGAWFASSPHTATAQAPYPNRSIRIVSALAAGSVSDISLRVIGEHKVELHLHTDVNVELTVIVEPEERQAAE